MPCPIIYWQKPFSQGLLIAPRTIASLLGRCIVTLHDDEVSPPPLPDTTPYNDRYVGLDMILEVNKAWLPLL